MRPPQSWSTARVTLALTLATAALWAVLTLLRLGDGAVAWGGFVPARIGLEDGGSGAPVWLTPLTAAFLHSTPLHLAVNLLFLMLCGRPTEAMLGPAGLLILYLLGAYAAAAGHYLADPGDPLPALGASGAVSAVVGAYSILFGRNKVKVANPRLALWLNALWLMAAWIGLQLIAGYGFADDGGPRTSVAAHIGGFLIGVALANPLLLLRYRKA